MRCNKKVVWDIESGQVIERVSFDYDGAVEYCCGGPTSQQKNAATSTSNLASEQAGIVEQNAAATQPFYMNEMNNGNPYFNAESEYSTSNLADQINQQKAQQKAGFAGYGGALPSGFAESADRDLSEAGAKAFDQNQLSLLQQQQLTKQQGAAGLSGQGTAAASTAVGGNQSVMQAPLSNSFFSNLVGGLIQGAGNIPFAFG